MKTVVLTGFPELAFLIAWTAVVAAMGLWGFRVLQRSRKTGEFRSFLVGPSRQDENPIFFRFQQGFLVFWILGTGLFFVFGITKTIESAVELFS